MSYSVILVDDPAPRVRRITLNRPEKRNALNTPLRREVILALREADADPDVRVSIIRGAGKCFSAGYDLGGDPPDAGAPADWFTVGRGPVPAPGHRVLDEHLGPRQAGDRAGAQLLPRRRERARDRL